MKINEHQFILGLINRAFKALNIRIFYVEGKFLGKNDLPYWGSIKILRHRPDLIGINQTKKIFIGEAKTASDLDSERTSEQILDFTSLKLNSQDAYLFLGIPASSEPKAVFLFSKLRVPKERYTIITVPDSFLKDRGNTK